MQIKRSMFSKKLQGHAKQHFHVFIQFFSTYFLGFLQFKPDEIFDICRASCDVRVLKACACLQSIASNQTVRILERALIASTLAHVVS